MWNIIVSWKHIKIFELLTYGRKEVNMLEHKCENCEYYFHNREDYPCVYCSLNENCKPIMDRFKECEIMKEAKDKKLI